MINLTDSLLRAQREPSRIPYIKLVASNKISGGLNLKWQRVYNGNETEYFHALAVTSDGSLIRARITHPADSRKLYIQRIANPNEEPDFSLWQYTGQYNAVIVAAAALGDTVSVFWIKSDRKIQQIVSSDCGITWSEANIIDYTPTTAVNGICAAYKPNGDLALFFADQTTLYIKQKINGEWQPKAAWDKTSGELSGVSAVYDSDWNIFITGKDIIGNFCLRSLVYGDGGVLPVGGWGEPQTIAEAPSEGSFGYYYAFLDKPDLFRCFYIEKYSGIGSYSRPFHIQTAENFGDNLWQEPQPFDITSEYGLAIAHDKNYSWLSCANGVWKAPLKTEQIDLSSRIVALKQKTICAEGKLTVELLGGNTGLELEPPLEIGCRLDLSLGYLTANGFESGKTESFTLQACEFINSNGLAKLVLHATNGWGKISCWAAKQQYRWNAEGSEQNILDLLKFILARAGVRTAVISASEAIKNLYPDFNINPGMKGDDIINKLMSLVPDLLFTEGDTAYIVNPLTNSESSYVYSFPQTDGIHPINRTGYKISAPRFNHIRVEGFSGYNNLPLIGDYYDYEDIKKSGEGFLSIQDGNIGTVNDAEKRVEYTFNKDRSFNDLGYIEVPTNCGQQIYDVIGINDSVAGLINVKRRVIGLETVFETRIGKYSQTLLLGKV
ncbi:MAG: hypothetical protein WC958_00585 [Dehalococcoidales bacterium]